MGSPYESDILDVCVCVCGIYIFFALNLCFYGFFLSNGILYLFCFLNLISRNGKRMAVTLIRTTWSHNAGLLGEYKCWVLLFRWWQRGGGGRFNCFEFILSRHRLFRRDFLFFFSIQNYWTNEENGVLNLQTICLVTSTSTRNWWMFIDYFDDKWYRNSRGVFFPILCQLMDTICVCVCVCV